MKQRGGQCGFTLLELMVVLTLIAIMSAMIIPEMRGTNEEAVLRAATREMVCALDLASSQAAATGTERRARLDSQTGRFVIEQPSRETAGEYEPVKDILGAAGEIDPRIAVQFVRPDEDPADAADAAKEARERDPEENELPQGAIRFFPDGTADARVIILTDRMGIKSILRVNPSTGRVRPMQPPKPE